MRLPATDTGHIERRTPAPTTFIQGWPQYAPGRTTVTFDVWNLKIGADDMSTFSGQIPCAAPCNLQIYLIGLRKAEPFGDGEWVSAQGRYMGNHSLIADTLDWEIY